MIILEKFCDLDFLWNWTGLKKADELNKYYFCDVLLTILDTKGEMRSGDPDPTVFSAQHYTLPLLISLPGHTAP